jgi:hypothetical protein
MSHDGQDTKRLLAWLDPDQGNVDRQLERLAESVPDGLASKRLLSMLPEPRAGVHGRLLARLEDWVATGPPVKRPFPRQTFVTVLAVVALVIGAASFTASRDTVVQSSHPGMLDAPNYSDFDLAALAHKFRALFEEEGVPLNRTLDLSAATSMATLMPGITVMWRGSGHVLGTDRAPRIDWKKGTLEVTRTRSSAPHVLIETGQALVSVGGQATITQRTGRVTVLAMLGTTEVRCTGGQIQVIEQGEQLQCP